MLLRQTIYVCISKTRQRAKVSDEAFDGFECHFNFLFFFVLGRGKVGIVDYDGELNR